MMPILRKELRTLLRERRGFLVPVLYALVLALVVGLYFVGAAGSMASRVSLGKLLAGTVAAVQSLALLLFSPLVGASMIAGERERGTWAKLLASPVSRDGIVLGKLAASCLYLFLLLSVSFPVAALSLLHGGLDLTTLAGLYLTQALLAACLVSIGLAVSTGFARTWTASFLALGIVLALSVGLPALSLGYRLGSASPLPGSVFEGAAHHRAQIVARVADWFNPTYGMELFFAPSQAHRLDWFAHYGALLLLGGGSLLVARFRLRSAGE
jgi:ABC-type transport system involved in multi-copper enzyme maturation permease subunit